MDCKEIQQPVVNKIRRASETLEKGLVTLEAKASSKIHSEVQYSNYINCAQVIEYCYCHIKVSDGSSFQSLCDGTAELTENHGYSGTRSGMARLKSLNGIRCHKGAIEVTLEGKSLWDEFYRRGTEMIVNRAGRLVDQGPSFVITTMFPGGCFLDFLLPLPHSNLKLSTR